MSIAQAFKIASTGAITSHSEMSISPLQMTEPKPPSKGGSSRRPWGHRRNSSGSSIQTVTTDVSDATSTLSAQQRSKLTPSRRENGRSNSLTSDGSSKAGDPRRKVGAAAAAAAAGGGGDGNGQRRRGSRKSDGDGGGGNRRRRHSSASMASGQRCSADLHSGYLVQQTAQNLLRRLEVPSNSVVGDRQHDGVTHSRCIQASEIVTWLVDTGDFKDRVQASIFMRALASQEVLVPVGHSEPEFRDAMLLYQFVVEATDANADATLKSRTDGGLKSSTSDSGYSRPGDKASSDTSDSAHEASSSADLARAISLDAADEIVELIDALERHGGAPTQQRLTTFMHRAVNVGAVKVARVLLARGVPVNCRTARKDTLLHRAAARGDRNMVSLLLELGADVEALDATNGTPILRAAAKRRNLECAILLLEYGAKLKVQDTTGKTPVELQPDLAEVQQRLCESAVNQVRSIEPNDALQALSRLVTNDENDATLIRHLQTAGTAAGVVGHCSKGGSANATEHTVVLLQNLFAPGRRRRRSVDWGLLGFVLEIMAISKGAVQHVAIDIIEAVAIEIEPDDGLEQTGYLRHLAKLDLRPLIIVLLNEGALLEDRAKTGRVLGMSSMFRSVQQLLPRTGYLPRLFELINRLTGRDNSIHGGMHDIESGARDTADAVAVLLEPLARMIGNTAMHPSEHQRLLDSGMLASLRPLLQDPSASVVHHAARALIYVGESEVGSANLFAPSQPPDFRGLESEQDMLLGLAQSEADPSVLASVWDWSKIKGSSLEKCVEMLTDPAIPIVKPLFFSVYQRFWHPTTLFRTVVHRFHSAASLTAGSAASGQGGDSSGSQKVSLHPVHDRVCGLLRIWVVAGLSDFIQNPSLLECLKRFLHTLQSAGGLYVAMADQLLDITVNPGGSGPAASGVPDSDYSLAAHHTLYEKAKQSVLSGKLPTTIELAVTLAAIQVHVEELARHPAGNDHVAASRGGGVTMPSVRPKNILPACFARSKIVLQQIEPEYQRFKVLSDRDAKHLYLHNCRLISVHECDYFGVKQVSRGNSKKLPRLLGVGPKKIMLLDDKTKMTLFEFPFTSLRSWRTARGKGTSKVPKIGRSVNHLMLLFETTELILAADEATIIMISSLLQRNVGMQLAEQEDAKAASERRRLTERAAALLNSSASSSSSTATAAAVAGAAAGTAGAAGATAGSGSGPNSRGSSRRSSGSAPSSSRRSSEGSAGATAGALALDGGSSAAGTAAGVGSGGIGSSSSSSGASPGIGGGEQFNSGSSVGDGGGDGGGAHAHDHTTVVAVCGCPPYPSCGGLNLQQIRVGELLYFPVELARQLTLSEHEKFKAISPSDCLDYVLKPRTPDGNCTQFIQHFDRVNRWVKTLVVSTHDRVARAVVIEQLVRVAAECYKLRNFNGMIEICLGLKSTSIQRLTETWDLVSKAAVAKCDELDKLMLGIDNFKTYRAAIAAANPPGIPYFGVCLKDLTFLHDGNKDHTRFGLVNVNKWRRMMKVLKDLGEFQEAQYNLISVKEIQHFLASTPVLNEDTIYAKSKALQP